MPEKFSPKSSIDMSIMNDVGSGMRTISSRGVGLAPKKTETLVSPPGGIRSPKTEGLPTPRSRSRNQKPKEK